MIRSKYLAGLLLSCTLVWANSAIAAQAAVVDSAAIAAEPARLVNPDRAETAKKSEQPFAPPIVSGNAIQPAPSDTAKPEAIKVGSGGHLANVALGLVFIVLLILALGWFMRRFNQGGMFNNSAIKIVAVTPLGTRERLLVVDISGQQLLLGVTATQINTLHVFNEPAVDVSGSSGSSEFGRKLLAAIQQKTSHQTPGTKNHSPTE